MLNLVLEDSAQLFNSVFGGVYHTEVRRRGLRWEGGRHGEERGTEERRGGGAGKEEGGHGEGRTSRITSTPRRQSVQVYNT